MMMKGEIFIRILSIHNSDVWFYENFNDGVLNPLNSLEIIHCSLPYLGIVSKFRFEIRLIFTPWVSAFVHACAYLMTFDVLKPVFFVSFSSHL